jgi:hypothetical protein
MLVTIVLGLLTLLLLATNPGFPARAFAANFTWRIISDNVPAPVFYHADGEAGFVKTGSNLWAIMPQLRETIPTASVE